MRILNISISDTEFNRFGLTNDKINFSDFIDLVSNELSRRNLNKSIELSEKYGLSTMTMDEIGDEVRATRNNAKNNY